jgi:hypothetical protein
MRPRKSTSKKKATGKPNYCVDTYNDAMTWSMSRCLKQLESDVAYREAHPLMKAEDFDALTREIRAVRRAIQDKAKEPKS